MRLSAIAVLCLAGLFATTAGAATLTDDQNKRLWCGEALVVAFSFAPDGAPADQLAVAKTYIDAGNRLIDETVKTLSGFTRVEIAKIKADLVSEVTSAVLEGSDPDRAKYSYEECAALIDIPPIVTADTPPAPPPVAGGGRRLALVIGNQNYANLESLQKSSADADSFARLFEQKGFDRVVLKHDLTRDGMDMAVADFAAELQPGDTAVFVYAGHGWSDGNQNYLVGTDAPQAGSAELLRRVTMPIENGADGILDEMTSKGVALKVAIIDACRDNPFAIGNGTRSVGMTRGFNRMTEVPRGTFVVFSAGAGQSALDRISDADADPNGVFTRTFVPLLAADMTLLDAVKQAQDAVFELAQDAGVEQEPAFYDQTRGNKACLSKQCSVK